MNEHPPADDSEVPAAAEVHVFSLGHDWWSWRYVERETGVELQSNDTFRSAEAAAASARKAYPDLEVAENKEEDGEEAGVGEMREPPPLL